MSNQPPPDPYGPPPGEQPADQPTYPQAGPPQAGPPHPASPPPGPPPPGQPPAYPPHYGASAPATNTLAIVSLICSLAGLLTWITAPVGAILGHIARKQIRERGEQGEGLALGGIIVGWVITGLGLLSCCGVIAAIFIAEAA